MPALARFESFMENMVEGSVARLFRSPVQPAEIAKRLERAMETQQTISVRRVIVPNVYRAFLNPQDLAALGPIRAEMEREMATYLAELAGHTQIFQPPAAGPTSQSRARLLLATAGGTHVIPLESTQLTIGRGLNNDVILEDTRVSRHHAQLRYRARRFWLSDLGSTNGTYINGEQVAEQALRDGDTISLGGLELTFKEA